MENRKFYISQAVINNIDSENGAEYCVVDNIGSKIVDITIEVEETCCESGRHDIAIKSNSAYINSHNFQLRVDYTDYGCGGYDFDAKPITASKTDCKKLVKNNTVLIYDEAEALDKTILLYAVDEVIADDIGTETTEIDETDKLNTDKIYAELKNGSLVLIPVLKTDLTYEHICWSTDKKDIFKFNKFYSPKLYNSVPDILSDRVTVPKDFVEYDFLLMNCKIETDSNNNLWNVLSYNNCIGSLDLLELDITGKTHMYVLDNFKKIDRTNIYNSFMKLDMSNVELNTMLRIIEVVQPASTKWFEDILLNEINNKQSYYFSNYVNYIVKYVRVSKKSADRNIEPFITMMLDHRNMDGYVRIFKALKLSGAALNERINNMLEADGDGYLSLQFIKNWKTESFEILEEKIYNEIAEGEKNATTYYFYLLDDKCVDKVGLINRYRKGIVEDPMHFSSKTLLDKLNNISYYKGKNYELIPVHFECLMQHCTDINTLVRYISYERIESLKKEIQGFSLYSIVSKYIAEFEPYGDQLEILIRECAKKRYW